MDEKFWMEMRRRRKVELKWRENYFSMESWCGLKMNLSFLYIPGVNRFYANLIYRSFDAFEFHSLVECKKIWITNTCNFIKNFATTKKSAQKTLCKRNYDNFRHNSFIINFILPQSLLILFGESLSWVCSKEWERKKNIPMKVLMAELNSRRMTTCLWCKMCDLVLLCEMPSK